VLDIFSVLIIILLVYCTTYTYSINGYISDIISLALWFQAAMLVWVLPESILYATVTTTLISIVIFLRMAIRPLEKT